MTGSRLILHLQYVIGIKYYFVVRIIGSVLVTIQVYDSSDSQPVVGQGYNLFCIASINVTGYQWRKNGQIIQEEMQQILVFPSLNLSDAGNYTCEVIINSNNYTADNKSIILESRFVIVTCHHIALIIKYFTSSSSLIHSSNKQYCQPYPANWS